MPPPAPRRGAGGGARRARKAQHQKWASLGIAAAGVLFALPAVWGLLYHFGMTDMFGERDNAEAVAVASILLGSAFALIMFASAGYLFWHASNQKG